MSVRGEREGRGVGLVARMFVLLFSGSLMMNCAALAVF